MQQVRTIKEISAFRSALRAICGLLLLCAAVLSLGVANTAHAQTVSATMVGTVSDKAGAATPNAKVTVVDLSTNIPHEALSNGSGNYSIPNLAPGTYSVTVEAPGFRRETRPSLDVVVNTTTRVDFELQPGAVSDTITVTDQIPLLQTDRADVSTKLEAEKLENLPLATNRNFQGLLNLIPGTTPASFQHSQFFNAQSSLQTQVNGTPRMGNSYQIEGIDDDERTGLLQIIIPPADAIQTVDISTNNFEAELGRAIGAVVNVTLKSGTNKFHGSASEYLQNSEFNAKSRFNSTKGHVAYNYYGGTFGGPIIKDKLFFFVDYFRTEDHEATANILNIPFRKYYTPNAAGNIDLSDLLKADGTGQVYDPTTGDQNTGAGRTPFVNNQIPIGKVNAVSLNLLKLIPAENQNVTAFSNPTNNYAVASPFRKQVDSYDAKINWQVSGKDHLSARYSGQRNNVFQAPSFSNFAGGPGNNGGFAATGKQNGYSVGINYDRAFSSSLLTEARIGVAHYRNDAQPSNYGTQDATTAGIPGVNIDQFTSGQIGVTLNGGFSNPILGYAASIPWIRAEANIDFVNHWTKIIGNHTFKFGADVRRIRDELLQGQTFSPRGLVTFDANQTSIPGGKTNAANNMASFLFDRPSTVGRDIVTTFPAYRQWWIFGFVGDKWQATPKLTLDIGVRWELYPPATPGKAGGFSNYDFSNNTLVVAGVGGNPSNLGMQTRYNYFAPRTGFAYRVSEGTVIRGGYGISYTPFPDNTYAYNYPVKSNNAYNACGQGFGPAVLSCTGTGSTAVAGPAVTFQAGFPAPVNPVVPSNGIIDAGGTLLAQSEIVVPKNFYNPYVHSWNLAVQQALPGNFSLQLSYVANHGVHIATAQNVNLGDRLNCGTSCYPGQIKFGKSASVTEQFQGNSTNYQSLQVQLTRRFTKGFSSTTAFTFGKGLGYQSADDGALLFSLQRRRNYAPNDFDRRLNLEQSFTYELPIGPGKRFLSSGFLGRAIGGFKLSSIISIVSGNPFTVTTTGGNINTSGQTQTANLVGAFKVLHGVGAGNQWFDPTQFAAPAGCAGRAPATSTTDTCPIISGVTVGNLGRNTFYGPGYIQDNLSAFKTFQIHENWSLETRVDAFQLSNTPQLANPGVQQGSTTFGQVTSVVGSGSGVNGIGGGRALQLAAIIKF